MALISVSSVIPSGVDRVTVHIEAMLLQHDFAENIPLLKEDIFTLQTALKGTARQEQMFHV